MMSSRIVNRPASPVGVVLASDADKTDSDCSAQLASPAPSGSRTGLARIVRCSWSKLQQGFSTLVRAAVSPRTKERESSSFLSVRKNLVEQRVHPASPKPSKNSPSRLSFLDADTDNPSSR